MQTIEYQITAHNPQAHLYRVSCRLARPQAKGQRFSLPAWIPGSYLIRDFARNIVSISAECEGEALAITKLDKQTWACAPCNGALTVICEIYARDESVRAAYLDTRRGFFNGTSVFLRPEGCEKSPCTVSVAPPPAAAQAEWRVATTLPAVAVDEAGFGDYRADDYTALIDHPVAMGEIDWVDFSVAGTPHSIALLGRHDANRERLAADLAEVCAVHAQLFGELPVARYVFLAQVVGEGYGGLEHRDCSMLQVARNSLPAPGMPANTRADSYMNLLGLCSHEYFHLWNVKRIRPQAVAESDLVNEAYFRDLWAYEGVTAYYDELALVRARLLPVQSYLNKLASAATRLEHTPGRHRQSLADSSFDAWTKFYRPDENTPNAVVSYYGKGALVALCLDLTLRRASRDHRCSLDSVMQQAWTRFGRDETPVPEGGLEQLCVELGGSALEDFFRRYVHGTEDPPFAKLLAAFAVRCERIVASDGGDTAAPIIAAHGVKLAANTPEARLQYVLNNGAAQAAGLSPGDVLVALEGLRLTPANLATRLKRLPVGSQARLQFFRGDELLETTLQIQQAHADTWRFTPDEDATAAATQRRKAWLGTA